MIPKNDTPAKPEPTLKFLVAKAFWLDQKHCAEGGVVELTTSQANRLGDAVKPAKAD